MAATPALLAASFSSLLALVWSSIICCAKVLTSGDVARSSAALLDSISNMFETAAVFTKVSGDGAFWAKAIVVIIIIARPLANAVLISSSSS